MGCSESRCLQISHGSSTFVFTECMKKNRGAGILRHQPGPAFECWQVHEALSLWTTLGLQLNTSLNIGWRDGGLIGGGLAKSHCAGLDPGRWRDGGRVLRIKRCSVCPRKYKTSTSLPQDHIPPHWISHPSCHHHRHHHLSSMTPNRRSWNPTTTSGQQTARISRKPTIGTR